MSDSAAKKVQEEKVAAEAAPVVTNATEEDGAAAAAAETDEEQVSRISAAVARARGALEEVKMKVSEYDTQYKASETASSYIVPPIQKAQAAFDELASTATALKDKTVEIPTKALTRTLGAANSALEQITELANKYDEKFKLSSTVQKAVSVPRDKCAAALVEASNLAASVSAAANAQLQGVNHGICSRAASIGIAASGILFSTVAALDGRFALEDKAVSAGTKVVGKAQELDERFSVKEKVGAGLERAQGLDSRVTGGRVTPLVLTAFEKGFELATIGLDFAKTGYTTAKQERQGNDEPKKDDETDGKDGQSNGGYEAAAQPPAAAAAAPKTKESAAAEKK